MRLVLVGDGRMGHAVAELARDRGHEVGASLGSDTLRTLDAAGLAGTLGDADAAVDFSVAEQVGRTVAAAARAGTPLVIGTTGWTDDAERVLAPAREAGVGVVHGPNFSVGVHLYLRLVREAARLADAFDDYDVHVHETHHRHKVDHPSGTARRIADILVEGVERKERWSADLPDGRAVEPSTLLVTSARVGEVPGTHVVGLEGPHDTVELRHLARGRAGFALGAVVAAEWIVGRSGIHTFESVLDARLSAAPRQADRDPDPPGESDA